MNRSIQDLVDLRTGLPLKADNILSQPEAEIHILRRKLRKIRLRFKKGDINCTTIACELCHQPVVIVGDKNRNYHFKHGHESGDCPIKTRGSAGIREKSAKIKLTIRFL